MRDRGAQGTHRYIVPAPRDLARSPTAPHPAARPNPASPFSRPFSRGNSRPPERRNSPHNAHPHPAWGLPPARAAQLPTQRALPPSVGTPAGQGGATPHTTRTPTQRGACRPPGRRNSPQNAQRRTGRAWARSWRAVGGVGAGCGWMSGDAVSSVNAAEWTGVDWRGLGRVQAISDEGDDPVRIFAITQSDSYFRLVFSRTLG
jgi:hypothetical protein